MSSFFTNFEKNFNLFEFKLLNKLTQSIIQKIEILKRVYDNIVKIKKKFSIY